MPGLRLAPAACYMAPASRDPRVRSGQRSWEQVVEDGRRGMERAATRWEPATVARRERAASELSGWLRTIQGDVGLSWQTMTPHALVAFLEGHWLPAHGTDVVLEDGSMGCAASTLMGFVSHLKTCFEQIGRRCPWGTAAASHCNPADSLEVRAYCGAYRRQYARAGHEAVAARPWGRDKVTQLLASIDATAKGTPMERVLATRDQALVCFMAETGKRGKDCGELKWVDFSLGTATGAVLAPAIWAPEDGDIVVCRMFSKTRKEGKGPGMQLGYSCGGEGTSVNALWRLHQYILARRAAGLSWGEGGWAFSPQCQSRRGLEDKPMSSAACCRRITKLLKEGGLYEGETPHGLRRGMVQEAIGEGLAEEDVMALADIQDKKTLRLYSSQERPVRG